MTTSTETTKERRRKSVYTDELGERVCRAIATSTVGIKRMVADDKTLPSESTIYLWVQLNLRFADNYKAARIKQADARMEAAQEAFIACKAEAKVLMAEKTKEARDEARILISLMNAEMQMQYRLAAWLAAKKSKDDDGYGEWRGIGKPFIDPANLDNIISF